MTENKRFTIVNMGLDGRLIKEDGKIMELERVVDLLNENEQLKLQNKRYSMMVNANHDLNDEIYEQLKKTEKNYKSVLEENEQLKSEITELKELLKSYRKTIKHDAELLADATKKGYLPPLEDWRGDVK